MRHPHLTHRFGRLQAIPSHPRPTPANTPLSSSMRKPLRVFSRIVDIRSWANTAMIPIIASPIGVDASTSRNGSVRDRHPTLALIPNYLDSDSLRSCQPIQRTDNKNNTLTQILHTLEASQESMF